MFGPGDLVEIYDPGNQGTISWEAFKPKPGWIGVVLDYPHWNPNLELWQIHWSKIVTVRFPSESTSIAVKLLRLIRPPPSDVYIPDEEIEDVDS